MCIPRPSISCRANEDHLGYLKEGRVNARMDEYWLGKHCFLWTFVSKEGVEVNPSVMHICSFEFTKLSKEDCEGFLSRLIKLIISLMKMDCKFM